MTRPKMPRLTLAPAARITKQYREESEGLAEVADLWRGLRVSPWMESMAAAEAMNRCRHLRTLLPEHHTDQAGHEDEDHQDHLALP